MPLRPPRVSPWSRAAVVALGLGLAGPALHAQDAPRAVAERLLAALTARQLNAILPLLDRQAIDTLAARHRASFRGGGASAAPHQERMLRLLYGVASVAEFERLPADSVVGRLFRRSWTPAHARVEPSPPLHFAIVGVSPEDATTSHVLVRARPRGPVYDARGGVQVLTLVARQGAWRVLPDDALRLLLEDGADGLLLEADLAADDPEGAI
jgi:hypothetical protein